MPTVVFRRSKLYDARLKRKDDFVMPEDVVFLTKIEELAAQWAKDGERILKAIEDKSGFAWHRKEIICYMTAGIIPFSDPLTLNLRSNIDTLTHELIHCILSESENHAKWSTGWAHINETYPEESPLTKTHIVVHAIHTPILKELFGEERYAAERDSMRSADYLRAWQIVGQDGHQSIIDFFN